MGKDKEKQDGNSNQIAGHSQSPLGILAITSTRPYLIATLPLVVKRADLTGFMMSPVVMLLVLAHGLAHQSCVATSSVPEVHVPSAVRFTVYLDMLLDLSLSYCANKASFLKVTRLLVADS
jgi:hypothetical protein